METIQPATPNNTEVHLSITIYNHSVQSLFTMIEELDKTLPFPVKLGFKALGEFGSVITLIITVQNATRQYLKNKAYVEFFGGLIGSLAISKLGSITGATLGVVVPGIGSIVGATVGAAIGAIAGNLLGGEIGNTMYDKIFYADENFKIQLITATGFDSTYLMQNSSQNVDPALINELVDLNLSAEKTALAYSTALQCDGNMTFAKFVELISLSKGMDELNPIAYFYKNLMLQSGTMVGSCINTDTDITTETVSIITDSINYQFPTGIILLPLTALNNQAILELVKAGNQGIRQALITQSPLVILNSIHPSTGNVTKPDSWWLDLATLVKLQAAPAEQGWKNTIGTVVNSDQGIYEIQDAGIEKSFMLKDTLLSNPSNKIVFGKDADSILQGSSTGDRLYGAYGHNVIYSNGGDDLLVSGGGGNNIVQGTGKNTIHAIGGDVITTNYGILNANGLGNVYLNGQQLRGGKWNASAGVSANSYT